MNYKDFLKQRGGVCPFCAPETRIIVENETAFLTYNISPFHKHHCMVIPKRHVVYINELSEAESRDIDRMLKTAMTLLERLGYPYTVLMLRNGHHPGKSIEHLHYQLLPNTDILPERDVLKGQREDKRVILTQEEIDATLADFARVQDK